MVSLFPGSSLGRYRVIEQLGRGGMATVFKCHDPTLDRHVAVKVLPSYYTEDPTFVGRFAQEARTVASLNNPNILQIFDFGDDKGFTYIVTEMVSGGTLEDKLTGEPLSIEDVLRYMRPLAQALDYAHASGIVHRDLKPANVLLSDDDRPILADFGLARMLESAVRFTQSNQALGTPEYMAPEQAMGADADHRSDLYAVGILLYQMILGQTPFKADTPAATLMAHVHRPLPLPSTINPGIDSNVEALLLKALAKDPEDRYQSTTEMIEALEEAVDLKDPTWQGPAVRAPAPAIPAQERGRDAAIPIVDADAITDRAQPRRGLPVAWIGAGAAVFVGIAAAAVFFLTQGGGSTPDDGQPAQTPPSIAGAAANGGSSSGAVAETPEATAAPVADDDPCPPLPDTGQASSIGAALSQLQGMQDRVHREIANLRQIEDPPTVEPTFRTREEICGIVGSNYRRPVVRDQIFEAEELYKALGIIDENASLEDILLGIQIQQASAWFDEQSGNVYLLSDAANITARFEVAYAAAHLTGLQQELFDIRKLRSSARNGTSDEFQALTALDGGDRSTVLNGYVERVIALDAAALEELQRPIPGNKLLAAPQIVQKTSLFGIVEGRQFVEALFARDGVWATVDSAYENPPETTEQVLHPEKYFALEASHNVQLPNISGRMGGAWSLTKIDTMGEFMLRSYLEEYLSDAEAEEAASGWGGDKYILMSNPDHGRLLVWQIQFDTGADADQFLEAYRVFMRVATQGTDTRQDAGPTGNLWVTEGGKTVLLGEAGPAMLLVIGDDEDAVVEAIGNLTNALMEQQSQP